MECVSGLLKKLEETLKAQQESLKYEKEKKDASKKKTRKQIENEALAIKIKEAKSKSINTIYRQLAKILHPDLEQDEVLKSEKAKVMQDVTQAYQEKNLPALLRLEMSWNKRRGRGTGGPYLRRRSHPACSSHS